jgi:UDP-N-acetylmuramyl pentapeptide synthase
MISMSLKNASILLSCDPILNDIEFSGITTDSRQIRPGKLFAA